MSRDRKAAYLAKLIGNRNVTRIQSWLKYVLTFRSIYTNTEDLPKTVIFMIDGRTVHGGLSDRLRGLFATYLYCKDRGYQFKVNWTYPFLLQDYLKPKTFDWTIQPTEMSYDRRNVAFRFFNSYSRMNNDQEGYYCMLQTRKPIIHVYSNVTLHEERFADLFNELFMPCERLEKAIQKCLTEISGGYISLTFRFIGLLGDFKEHNYPALETESEKEEYVSKCLSAVERLYSENTNIKRILVTADSPKFLQRVIGLPYVYCIPGNVVHMDNVQTNDFGLHLKSFLDFMMISKAERCYAYSYGRMFRGSKFAKTAALIGGKKFIDIKE